MMSARTNPEAGEVIDLPESVVEAVARAICDANWKSSATPEFLREQFADEILRPLFIKQASAALLAALPHFQALVLAEREACAKVAESRSVHGLGNSAYDNAYDDAAVEIAAAIRRDRQP